MAGRVTRGEVRLCEFPRPDKARPVVILTRTAALAYLTRVTVAPVTSAIRDVPTEVVLTEQDGMKHPSAVNLHNVITVDRRRIGRRVGSLGALKMREICRSLAFALACADEADEAPDTD